MLAAILDTRAMTMALQPIPPDPEPSQAEIDAILAEKPLAVRPSTARALARIVWKAAKERTNPDAFHVPFANKVEGYEAYLLSPEWEEIRDKVLRGARFRCAGCAMKATQVHHRDYRPRVLRGDDLAPLVALCGACHHKVHHQPGGKWRECWEDEERALADMVATIADG